MKIRLVRAEFPADGQTDMTKIIIAFCNFSSALKNGIPTQVITEIGYVVLYSKVIPAYCARNETRE
jgi:hypothetical protein